MFPFFYSLHEIRIPQNNESERMNICSLKPCLLKRGQLLEYTKKKLLKTRFGYMLGNGLDYCDV